MTGWTGGYWGWNQKRLDDVCSDRLAFWLPAFSFLGVLFGSGGEGTAFLASLLVLFLCFLASYIWCRRLGRSIIRKTGGFINQYRTGLAQRSEKRR